MWFEERNALCIFIGAFCIISCFASLVNIMAISINRYVHICHPQVRLSRIKVDSSTRLRKISFQSCNSFTGCVTEQDY